MGEKKISTPALIALTIFAFLLGVLSQNMEENPLALNVEDNVGETVAEIYNDSSFAWVHINGLRTGREPDFYFITIPPYKYTVAVSYYGNVEVLSMELITKSEK